jgi:hypothetical protein
MEHSTVLTTPLSVPRLSCPLPTLPTVDSEMIKKEENTVVRETTKPGDLGLAISNLAGLNDALTTSTPNRALP